MLTTKYGEICGLRMHTMMMSTNKLKGMDMEISDVFIVHFHYDSATCTLYSLQDQLQYIEREK